MKNQWHRYCKFTLNNRASLIHHIYIERKKRMQAIDSAIRKNLTILVLGTLTMAAVFVAGCKKNDSTPNTPSVTASADVSDAADAVSDALASNNGGAMDQVNDVFEIAGGVAVSGGVLGKTYGDTTINGAVYDSSSMSWTKVIVRGDSLLYPAYYGYWTRIYWLQFRSDGHAQEFRKTNNVVADTILHQLLGGTGYFWTPRLVHHLLSIYSNWTVSNTNTDTVTINGSYTWSGIDSIKSTAVARKGRVLNRKIILLFENVKGPKGPRVARSAGTSGTIVITYTATVTAPGKLPYTVTEQFTVVLGGGSATFSIEGTKFVSDLATGDH
jgi:hypothetical protein